MESLKDPLKAFRIFIVKKAKTNKKRRVDCGYPDNVEEGHIKAICLVS
jgi:hypothetical protein